MALSMDEQRMLAEIEQRLAAEDPGLAARLTAFRRPSRVSVFRSARARVIGSLLTVAVVAMVSLMVYAMLPFRSGSRTSGHPPVTTVSSAGTGQPRIGVGPGTKAAKNATAKNATAKNSGASASAPAKRSPAKSTAAKAASGSTAQHSPSSAVGAAVHQADGSSGTTAQPATASQGP